MSRTILFLSHTAELNGAERWLLETMTSLDRSRFRPVLAVPGPGPLEAEAAAAGIAGVIVPSRWWLTPRSRVWTQPATWLLNRRSVRRLGAALRGMKAELVFTNSSAFLSGALAARATRLPHVWMIHELLGPPRPQLVCVLGRRRLLEFILDASAAVLVNSRAAAGAFGGDARVTVVYNGIPGWASRPVPAGREAVRTRWGVADGEFLCGVVGKICADKGQREAVLALDALRARRPGLKLLLVGAAPESAYTRSLRALIRARGLEEAVVLTGYQEDVHSLYAAMDLVVVGSGRESFGRTALEAAAVGVPVLAVRGGGIEEVVEQGRTGWIVESGRPDALSAGIAFVLDHPAETREAAARARAEARRRFDRNAQVRKVESVLEAALG
ncbi:MAG: glycosyltransferase family 4 protein [Candidatus Aminicenantes bacterium]|nr:glycosyltransferase family 4 protein [Candidatus Aminicenantes bacterium]